MKLKMVISVRNFYRKYLKPFLMFRMLKRFLFGLYSVFSKAILATYIFNNVFTFIPSNTLRVFYLRYVLGHKIGKNNFVHLGCNFYGQIKIGNNFVIGRKVILKGGIIVIGNNVSITAETYIQTGSHFLDDENFKSFETEINIRDRVWIGLRSIILPGVTVEEGSVLGAGSVLTKSIPKFQVFAGVPAKYIKTRNSNISYNLDYRPYLE